METIEMRKSANCYSGGICYLLEREGVYLSEAVSFILSGGLGWKFTVSPLYLSFVQKEHCLTEYISSLGVNVHEHTIKSYNDFLQITKSHLIKNKPLMVRYDGFYTAFVPAYNKIHAPRISFITGIDNKGIYITDFIYHVINYFVAHESAQKAMFIANGSCVNANYFSVSYPAYINNTITPTLCEEKLIATINIFEKDFFPAMERFAKQPLMTMRRYEGSPDMIQKEFIENAKQGVILLEHYAKGIQQLSSSGNLHISKLQSDRISYLFEQTAKQLDLYFNRFIKCIIKGYMKDEQHMIDIFLECISKWRCAYEAMKPYISKRSV